MKFLTRKTAEPLKTPAPKPTECQSISGVFKQPQCLLLDPERSLALRAQHNISLDTSAGSLDRSLHPLQQSAHALGSMFTYIRGRGPTTKSKTAIYIGAGLFLTASHWLQTPFFEAKQLEVYVKNQVLGAIDFTRLAAGDVPGAIRVRVIAHMDPRIEPGPFIKAGRTISRSLGISLLCIDNSCIWGNYPSSMSAALPGLASLATESSSVSVSFLGYNTHMKLTPEIHCLYPRGMAGRAQFDLACEALQINRLSTVTGQGSFSEPCVTRPRNHQDRFRNIIFRDSQGPTAAFCAHNLSTTPSAAGGAVAIVVQNATKLIGIHVGTFTVWDPTIDTDYDQSWQPKAKPYPATANLAINFASTRFRKFAKAEILPRLRNRKLKTEWIKFLDETERIESASMENPQERNDSHGEEVETDLKKNQFGRVCLDMEVASQSMRDSDLGLE